MKTLHTFTQFVVLLSLPLLLGGCGETEVNYNELEYRGNSRLLHLNLFYLKGADTPFTGKAFMLYKNGKKRKEGKFKDGKRDGPITAWHENGQKLRKANYKDGKRDGLEAHWHENGKKKSEVNWKDGIKVEGSAKYWNSKGEPVDSIEEAQK